ncbi:sugar ABC transporter ATP-binding protein [Rhizobium sp. LjRoot30]|uniref:sugar ABC transporter ATP-binding protein n=1 Tax=Rhizobium sp. LjRoot30 TaxID=3342320 RepID=UPI003ECF8995
MTVQSALASPRPVLEVIDVTKRYPGVLANDAVSFAMYPGRIHGLLGENGSGKSTIIKTLSGVQRPDSGEIRIHGREVSFSDPIAARSAGIATVFQEFSIVPTLSVAENIFLGRMPTGRFGLVDWQKVVSETVDILGRLGVEIDPEEIVGSLSVAQQQMVEIAKAVATGASLMILDEPTAALGLDEIAQLHALLRRMRDQGASLLYVSHRLDEVVSLVDDVTILRGGKVVSAAGATEVKIDRIVSAMIGSDVKEHYPKVNNATDTVVLEAKGISTRQGVSKVDLTLHAGEVLGLGGVLGAGRTEIARALFGVDGLTEGEILIDGHPVKIRAPSDAIAAGMALISENRKFDGLFFNFTGKANISVASLDRIKLRGLLSLEHEYLNARRMGQQLEITKAAPDKLVGHLSGGNQQKVILARWLMTGARVLILDEPTQGIDIGAKLAIYDLINRLTSEGKAVILISSDHEELLAMSDTIAIVRHGSVVRVAPAAALNHTDLVKASADEVSEHGALHEIPA